MATKASAKGGLNKNVEEKAPKIKKTKTQKAESPVTEKVKVKKEVAPKKEVVKKTSVKKEAVAKSSVKKESKKTEKVKVEKVAKETKTPVKKSAKTSKKKDVALKDETVMEQSEEKETKPVEKKSIVKNASPVGSTSIEELFEAGAHFGHVVKKWNPKMTKFLWGAKNGIHIFDLEKTMTGLNEASKALTQLATEGKRIVLVGTKRQAKMMVREEAERIGVPFITERWIGGLITNWKQIKQTIDRLNSLKQQREAGQLKKYTKKEQGVFDKEISKMEREIGGIAVMKEAPEVVVVFDTHKEKLAVKEASSRGVKVFGLVDSNANPDEVDFVIPMNDDSAKGLEIVIGVLGKAIENGLKNKEDKKEVK